MGISQQIGSSSLSKPGVCTSSTRPATPYEGQMIYETDTDKVLVYNGSAWKQVPTAATAGAVLQVVQGVLNSVISSSSATLVTTGLTATITPQYTTSKILVMASITSCRTAATITGIELAFYRGATNVQTIEKNLGYNSSSTNTILNASGILLDSPATIAATTYAVYFARSTGTGLVDVNNGSNTTSTITLQEISA